MYGAREFGPINNEDGHSKGRDPSFQEAITVKINLNQICLFFQGIGDKIYNQQADVGAQRIQTFSFVYTKLVGDDDNKYVVKVLQSNGYL